MAPMHPPQVRKQGSGCGNRSWTEEDEAFLVRNRSQKMPYKAIAAQLRKTELACRLHFHQLTHGSARRKRTASGSSGSSDGSAASPRRLTNCVRVPVVAIAPSGQIPVHMAGQIFHYASPMATAPGAPVPMMHSLQTILPKSGPTTMYSPVEVSTVPIAQYDRRPSAESGPYGWRPPVYSPAVENGYCTGPTMVSDATTAPSMSQYPYLPAPPPTFERDSRMLPPLCVPTTGCCTPPPSAGFTSTFRSHSGSITSSPHGSVFSPLSAMSSETFSPALSMSPPEMSSRYSAAQPGWNPTWNSDRSCFRPMARHSSSSSDETTWSGRTRPSPTPVSRPNCSPRRTGPVPVTAISAILN